MDPFTADPLWELGYCVLQWFEQSPDLESLTEDPLWELECYVLLCFEQSPDFGLTHCRPSLGAGILCFTMVFELGRSLGSLTADPF